MLESITKYQVRRLTPFLFLAVLFVFAGCAGPLVMDYTPARQDGARVKVSGPVKVYVDSFEDTRPAEGASRRGSRVIGNIDAVVADMRGSELVVDRDVTTIVEAAFATELGEAGYTVAPNRGGADVVVAGEVRSFALDIASRDEIAIDIAATFADASGRELWSGGETLKDDRYAGVMGNSRGGIEKYINASLSTVVGTMVNEATPVVSATLAMTGGAAVSPAAPSPAEAVSGGQPAQAGKAVRPIPAGMGRLDIDTGAVRAKVYLDGVYYGLTPVSLDVEPGIYDLALRLDGAEGLSEKVSVREGQTTEMEADLGE